MAVPNDLMPLYDIAAKFRRSPECVRLWITKGILVNGERHKLTAIKVGGTWLVSEEELYTWISTSLRTKGDEV